MSRKTSLWILLAICILPGPAGAVPLLFVSDLGLSSVQAFDGSSGAFVTSLSGVPGGYSNPTGLAIGPDGNLYSADQNNNAVYKFSGQNGAFLSTFASGALTFGPTGLAFSDGSLYVGNPFGDDGNGSGNGAIEVFNSAGTHVQTFGAGAPNHVIAPNAMAFGPDGNLYVADPFNGIDRYSAAGAFIDVFVPLGFNPITAPANLSNPFGLVFDALGDLYVTDETTSVVDKFAPTGTFLGVLSGSSVLAQPTGITIGPDGNFYVVDSQARVAELNGSTGAYIQDFVPLSSGELNSPQYLVFTAPEPGTMWLAGALAIGLAILRRRR